MRIETAASLRIQKARTALVLDHPFFGSLLFRLKGRESRSIKTMATDGVSLYYNPDFVDTLNAATLAGTLAHEVMHPALHHHVRRSGRDPKRWNIACDHAINPLLVDAGLSLPEGVLLDNRFRGMSAEQIYNLLDTESDSDQELDSEEVERESGGDGAMDAPSPQRETDEPSAPETGGGIGQVLDAPDEDDETPAIEEQVREWNVAVDQATTVARRAGKVPAGLDRTLEGAAEAAVDWRELLRRLWSETSPADFSWMRPNRRHVWQGLYLPGTVREGVGEVAVAVDCSGSVGARQLALFEAEIRSILEGQRAERVYVMYFDAVVHKIESTKQASGFSSIPLEGVGPTFGLASIGLKKEASYLRRLCS
jgi:predicted metal-dependent peptidase